MTKYFRNLLLAVLSSLLLVSSVYSQTYCGTGATDPVYSTTRNLMLYSEQADNAAWTKTRSSVTANSSVAPDGTTTVDKLVEDGTAANDHRIQQTVSGIVIGQQYRVSFYAKAEERTWAAIYAGFSSATQLTNFNLSTGQVGTISTNVVSTSVEATPVLGMYRYTIVVTANATSGIVYLYIGEADNDVTYSGDGVSGISIWGRAVNVSTDLPDYAPTTSAAVYYIRAAGLSEKATLSNLVTYSEQIDHANWSKARVSATANAINAPDGTLTAEKLTSDNTNGTHVTNSTAVTVSTSLSYRMVAYARIGTHPYFLLSSQAPSTAKLGVNLATGAIGLVGSSVTSYSVKHVGTGWYRVELNYVPTSTTDYVTLYLTDASYTTSWTPTGTETIFAWGAELNLSSAPADYLVTTTAAATLGPLCAAGTTRSPKDSSRCIALTTPIYTEAPAQINMGR